MILFSQTRKQNDCREGDVDGMDGKQWFQCQSCGHLYQVDAQFDIENDLFVRIECRNCRDETNHLWIGSNPEDVYIYGNLNADPRYYKYNTK